jgi:hypothetical protein
VQYHDDSYKYVCISKGHSNVTVQYHDDSYKYVWISKGHSNVTVQYHDDSYKYVWISKGHSNVENKILTRFDLNYFASDPMSGAIFQ